MNVGWLYKIIFADYSIKKRIFKEMYLYETDFGLFQIIVSSYYILLAIINLSIIPLRNNKQYSTKIILATFSNKINMAIWNNQLLLYFFFQSEIMKN